MSAIPLSQVLGAPVSAALIRIHWLGLSGWRWLLILEGVPAVLLGIVTLYYLTDRPQQATWLPEPERKWLMWELERERQVKRAAEAGVSVWRALSNPNLVLLTIGYFCGAEVQYGFGIWLPKMIQRLSGLPSWEVALISALPYLASWPAMLVVGHNSDRTGERRWHTAAPVLVAGAALAASQIGGAGAAFGIAMFTIAAMGINSRLPGFWALPPAFLGGARAAAAIGAINCIGNTGGFVGPYVMGYLSSAGGYKGGILALTGSAFLGGVAVLLVRVPRQPRPSR